MSEHIYEDSNMEHERYHVIPFGSMREEIVRCRDCRYGIDGGKYCAEDCADSWDWRNVEPDGFCAWGERRTDDN